MLRLDLNVAVGRKLDKESTWRLVKALPTINYLLQKQAVVIIAAHLGRPDGRVVKNLTLRPIANYLARLCGRRIELWTKPIAACAKLSQALLPGQVVMLENIRFHKGEDNNSKKFAKDLSKLADLYVNDAFGNIHRPAASMLGVTEFLPSYAGLLVAEEVEKLSKIFTAKQGLAVILGGAKISSKIKLIKKFTKVADKVLLGGGLANTLLAAQGYELGKSLVDKELLTSSKKLLSKKVILPVDLAVALSTKATKSLMVPIDKVPKEQIALDLGPKTISYFAESLKKAKLIVWNGPLGYFENPLFRTSSLALARALIKLPAKVIIGGGETVTMLSQAGLINKFYFASTGGGAMLAFLENNKLPVLAKLTIK